MRWCVDRRCGERSGQASAAARCRPRGQAEGPARGPSVSPSLYPMSDVKREQTFRTEIKTETEPLRPRSRTRPVFRPCRSKSRTKFWRSDRAETFGCETEIETRPDVEAGQGPDLQNILRQSYDYLTIMQKLRSTYDGRLIYKNILRRAQDFFLSRLRFTCKLVRSS